MGSAISIYLILKDYWLLKIVLCDSCSFSAFHFDFTGDKGVGKSSLVRRFLLGEFGEDYPGGRPSETLFFYFF